MTQNSFSRIFPFVCALLLLARPAGAAIGGTGASLDESVVHATVYVRQAGGSDASSGMQDAPVQTIGRAFQIAGRLLAQKKPVRVLVFPGTYREALGFGPPNLYNALFVLEGTNRDTCIVTGADRWTQWSGPDTAGVYSKPWPYKWGAFTGPQGNNAPVMAPELLRYENVCVDDRMYLPKVSRAALLPGSFFVDETAGLLYLRPAAGVNPNALEHDVEVTTRIGDIYDPAGNHRDGSLLHLYRPDPAQSSVPANVVVRGLTFQMGPGGLYQSALNLQNAANCLVENCRVRLNGYDGLGVSGNHDTVRGCLCENNGEKGMGSDGDNMLIEDTQVRANCGKGQAYDWDGWDGGGFKCGHLTHSTLRRLSAIGNFTKGMWFDTSCVGVLVEGCASADNRGRYSDGLFWENNNRNNVPGLGTQTTGLLRNCRFTNNGAAGFFTSECENVTLQGCMLSGNHTAQFGMYNGPMDAGGHNRGPLGNIGLQSCTLAVTGPDQTLYGPSDTPAPCWSDQFFPSLHGTGSFRTDGNMYKDTFHIRPFPDASGKQAALTLTEWKTTLSAQGGADSHSRMQTVKPGAGHKTP